MSAKGITSGQGDHIKPDMFASENLPVRRERRPATLRGPLHIQANGHGDRKYLHELAAGVLSWPYIEATPPKRDPSSIMSIRVDKATAIKDSNAFLTPREFARILFAAATIYLVLPLVSAHWAIVRGWAEPHYLRSSGFMPPGALIVYTPRNPEELSVCYSLFFAAYHSACKLPSGSEMIAKFATEGNLRVIAAPS